MSKENAAVFVSSTYADLKEYRSALWSALVDLPSLSVRGMEEFGARTSAPLDTCLEEVTQSDIYVGLIGFRFGSLDVDTGKSYTQLEYERAVELKKEILIYFLDPQAAKVLAKDVDVDHNRTKLESFKSILKERHTIDLVANSQSFVQKVEKSVKRILDITSAAEQVNEIYDTENMRLLRRFPLVPSTVRGRDAVLSFSTKSSPFALSTEACDAFGLTFGASVCIMIKIENPEFDNSDYIEHLLIGPEFVDQILELSRTSITTAKVRLGFTEKTIRNMKTAFVGKTVTELVPNPNYDPSKPADFLLSSMSSIFFNDNPRMLTEKHYQPGDGQAVYIIKEIINITDNEEN